MRGACALMLMSNRFTQRGGTSWSMWISTSWSTVIGTNAAKIGASCAAAMPSRQQKRAARSLRGSSKREPLGSGRLCVLRAPTPPSRLVEVTMTSSHKTQRLVFNFQHPLNDYQRSLEHEAAASELLID